MERWTIPSAISLGQDGHVSFMGRKPVLVGDAFLTCPLCNTCATWNICTACPMAKPSCSTGGSRAPPWLTLGPQ
ncbi:Anoctamin-2 [Manis javanica]|nr:Anoctamin-2 [Manis javanica]